MVITGRSAQTKHRIVFRFFEWFATNQRRVFVRLEVAQSDNYRVRMLSGRDAGDALRQLIDEIIRFVFVSVSQILDLSAHLSVFQLIEMN